MKNRKVSLQKVLRPAFFLLATFAWALWYIAIPICTMLGLAVNVPQIDSSVLLGLNAIMLGLVSYRTYEKLKEIDSKDIYEDIDYDDN